jgi:hypothetical protein
MQLEVKIIGVDIHGEQSTQGPPTAYDGVIRVRITAPEHSGFQAIETSIAFRHMSGIAEAVTWALKNLRDYGFALALAADKAAKVAPLQE